MTLGVITFVVSISFKWMDTSTCGSVLAFFLKFYMGFFNMFLIVEHKTGVILWLHIKKLEEELKINKNQVRKL